MMNWLRRPVPDAFLDHVIGPIVNSGLLPHRLHAPLQRRSGMSPERQVLAIFNGPRSPVRWGHLLGVEPTPADWRGGIDIPADWYGERAARGIQ